MQETIKKLLEINIKINVILNSSEAETLDDIGEFLKEKDVLIQSLKSLKEADNQGFLVIKKSELWKKLQEFEAKNLKLINDSKEGLSEEINGIKIHVKAISSYRFKKEQEPRLFDDSF